MKKILKYITLLSSIVVLSSLASAKNVIVAIEATYPPFESLENGKFIGFDIDLIKAVAKNLGYDVVFKDMQFASIFPSLNSGKVDMSISGITITDERKKTFNFSVPYIEDTLSIVAYKDSGLNNAEALKGKKVCVQLGTTNEIWVKKSVPSADLSSMDSTGQCVEAVNVKQVDAAILNSSQIKSYLTNYPNIEAMATIPTDEKLGILFPKKSKYYKEFNDELQRLIDNGFVAELIKKWM